MPSVLPIRSSTYIALASGKNFTSPVQEVLNYTGADINLISDQQCQIAIYGGPLATGPWTNVYTASTVAGIGFSDTYIIKYPYQFHNIKNISANDQTYLDSTLIFRVHSHAMQITNAIGITGPISGTVAVSNFPATQPVSGTVNVSNTAFEVSNFPATQPVSGTVAVSNTFLTVKTKPTYSISIDSASNTSQTIRASAGVVHTVIITSLNTSFPMPSLCDYVKIYNSSSATSGDTPLATIPIRYGETITFQADMNFSAGLCVRATSAYVISDTSVPGSTIYLTCFLTGYSE